MTRFAILVDFRLRAGTQSEFRRLVDANAGASLQNETGCRRFDVLEPQGDGDRVMLYEIYDDEAAFDAHCGSAHFERFEQASRRLVQEKTVIRCDLVQETRTSAEI